MKEVSSFSHSWLIRNASIHTYGTAYQSCFVPLANRICYADSVVYVCVFTYIITVHTILYGMSHRHEFWSRNLPIQCLYVTALHLCICIYGTTEVYQYMSLSNACVYRTIGVWLGKSLNVSRRLVLTLSQQRECVVMTWVTMGFCLSKCSYQNTELSDEWS